MARKNTIRLLLINASDNESERLISLFRAAGRVARAHRLSGAEDLHNQLQKSAHVLDDWDLLIADDHPDMVLKLDDFVSFKANWQPKADNIQQMALDLNLGLESFVFIDDNPAEIAVVQPLRQLLHGRDE